MVGVATMESVAVVVALSVEWLMKMRAAGAAKARARMVAEGQTGERAAVVGRAGVPGEGMVAAVARGAMVAILGRVETRAAGTHMCERSRLHGRTPGCHTRILV